MLVAIVRPQRNIDHGNARWYPYARLSPKKPSARTSTKEWYTTRVDGRRMMEKMHMLSSHGGDLQFALFTDFHGKKA